MLMRFYIDAKTLPREIHCAFTTLRISLAEGKYNFAVRRNITARQRNITLRISLAEGKYNCASRNITVRQSTITCPQANITPL